MHVFNQLEGEQALVSFVSPKYRATDKAAQASLLEGAFQLGVSELTSRLEVGTQTPRDTLSFSRLSCDRSTETQGAEGRATLTLPCGDAAF